MKKACLLFFTFCFLCAMPFVYAQEGREKAESLLNEAAASSSEGKADRAAELVNEAVKADPNYPEAYDQLGYICLKRGRFEDALNAFNSALKINPNLRTSKTGIGLSLLKKGDMQGAEITLKDALSMNPYPSMTHYALGLLYEKQNDYEKALEHFKEGLRTYKSGKK